MKNPTDLHQLIFSNFKIKPGIKASVVIPVKDEEYYIEKVLQSLSHQVDLDGNLLDVNFFEILILANNCTDHSVDLIKNFQLNQQIWKIFLIENNIRQKHF
ncbi:hypothetical protein ASG01_15010 [Chryseobacterium sp. Leaf180]|uniref:glycosyltransferase n=1 Tax=Chryseobacterium sp. Leaf180 TaxID=1736289 RepID=UPI0006F6327A|nr:glycosyltransferase family A protein [Chryseobacterium sp. Leaf180]KQR90870.1 hypothetical protein ASG01_15010 [Chryseobacterium sp. Leaf180]